MVKLKKILGALAHLSQREKLIFYAAIFAISIAAGDRLVISPIATKIGELNKEITDTELGIKNDLRILSQKDRITAESAKLATFSGTKKSDEEEITSLLKEVENFANKVTVYLVDMKPAPIKEAGSFKKYMINLNCEAQMEQIVDFMYNIENSNKLLVVEKYQLSPKSKESSVVQMSMTISKTVIQ